MSGETDNGLSFGASIDLDESDGTSGADGTAGTADDVGPSPAFGAATQGGETIFLSGDFGTITMGDTDGAFDWAMTEVNFGSPGSIDDSETGHAGFNGNAGLDGVYDGQILRYDYTVGDFGVAVSAQLDDNNVTDGDPALGLGLTYGFAIGGGTVDFGLGYETVDDTTIVTAGAQGVTGIGLSAAFALDSGLSMALNYTQINDDGLFGDDGTHTGIGVSYEIDAITLHANYGEFDWDAGANQEDSSGFGLAAAYDLGGGLSAHVGYGSSEYGNLNSAVTPTNDSTSYSFGLSMSF
jgi:outer membrane protein OmpU